MRNSSSVSNQRDEVLYRNDVFLRLVENEEVGNYPAFGHYSSTILLSASASIFLLSMMRILAVSLWSHFSFMAVVAAGVGLVLGGLLLAFRGYTWAEASRRHLPRLCALSALSMVSAYVLIAYLPLELDKLTGNSINMVYLGSYFIALMLPFFFSAQFVLRVLCSFPLRATRLTGISFLGMALAGVFYFPAIKLLGAAGLVTLSAFAAIIAVLGVQVKATPFKYVALFALGALLLLSVFNADDWFSIDHFPAKRTFSQLSQSNKIYATKWSAASRVDIAYYDQKHLKLWIDGGSADAIVMRWDGNLKRLKEQSWHSAANVFNLKQGTDPRVLIIGSAGGMETLFALSYGAAHINALEADSTIAEFMTKDTYVKNFIGNIYGNNKVAFVNENARSYLTRAAVGKYDIIQFVNNTTDAAVQAGAINFEESYLLTKEAFESYFEHLNEQGVIAVHRGGTLRVALTAMAALREQGVAVPADHVVILHGEVPYFEGLFIKKSPWTYDEVVRLKTFMKPKNHIYNDLFAYHPFRKDRQNTHTRILTLEPKEQNKYIKSLGVNLFPVTDDSPYLERFLKIGNITLSDELPIEFKNWNADKWLGLVPRGELLYVLGLIGAGLLSLLCFGLPLYQHAQRQITTKMSWSHLGLFALSGFSMGVLLISFVKSQALLFGSGLYSFAIVFTALALGAESGNILGEKAGQREKLSWLKYPLLVFSSFLLIESFYLGEVMDKLLPLSFTLRCLFVGLNLFSLGFCLGLIWAGGFFAINAYQQNANESRRLIAWSFVMLAYGALIAVTATAMTVVSMGFKYTLLFALGAYLLSCLCLWRISVNK
ncbi:MAG: hypothetical protein IT292_07460 [Deltaproteobacteria bacterium]|nr:hypothetical protein [Deltaproteobacteria bacterium]